MKWRDVERLIKDNGFIAERQAGAHVTFKHADGRTLVISKNPTKAGGSEFGPPIIRKLKKRLGIKH